MCACTAHGGLTPALAQELTLETSRSVVDLCTHTQEGTVPPWALRLCSLENADDPVDVLVHQRNKTNKTQNKTAVFPKSYQLILEQQVAAMGPCLNTTPAGYPKPMLSERDTSRSPMLK